MLGLLNMSFLLTPELSAHFQTLVEVRLQPRKQSSMKQFHLQPPIQTNPTNAIPLLTKQDEVKYYNQLTGPHLHNHILNPTARHNDNPAKYRKATNQKNKINPCGLLWSPRKIYPGTINLSHKNTVKSATDRKRGFGTWFGDKTACWGGLKKVWNRSEKWLACRESSRIWWLREGKKRSEGKAACVVFGVGSESGDGSLV